MNPTLYLQRTFMLFLIAPFCGCASYNYAEQIKTVSFTEDMHRVVPVGNIRGEDCSWEILGVKAHGDPSLERAFNNARYQSGGEPIRFVTGVHTQNSGVNFAVASRNCIVVTGQGYK